MITILRCAIIQFFQSRAIHEDERRASSYHSYSQSPPYDYQYEDRRYGKQAASLTRKPGSDRGRYEGKMSSFVYSPNRLSDDRFASEGSISRVSDYSASSGGDPFRSGAQSPNFQKDEGFSSPAFHLSRDGSSEDVRHRSTDSFPQVYFLTRRSCNAAVCVKRKVCSYLLLSFIPQVFFFFV